MGTPAGAFFVIEHTDITCAITKQRESVLGNTSEDQLADAAFRQHFTGFWVDNFRDKIVFVDVHTVLVAALKSDARAGNLGQAID